MQTIKEETDGLHEELEFIRLPGTDLIFACGETEKPEVKKSIDEVGKAAASYSHRMREELAWKSLTSFVGNLLQMNNAWENLNKTWKERLEKLEEAMQAAVQYQDTLQVRDRAVRGQWADLGSSTVNPLHEGYVLMQGRKMFPV